MNCPVGNIPKTCGFSRKYIRYVVLRKFKRKDLEIQFLTENKLIDLNYRQTNVLLR